MKTVGIIAEYNPLHLGHIKQIEYVKNVLKADKIIVIMSGNFTQRGESAVLNKFTRAKEVIQAGADTVIELPTVFAVSNAEVFAKGAINLKTYIKCYPENAIANRQKLLEAIESEENEAVAQLSMQLQEAQAQLQQASQAMLTQAMQRPQQVLQLLQQ